MYHVRQEDSQNGAKSQVAGYLHLGAAANPKFKPTFLQALSPRQFPA